MTTVRSSPNSPPSSPRSARTVSSYTVTLREGVIFHNGKALTSEDVKFSFETIGADESTSQWKPRVSMISSIETPDDKTVVFTLGSIFTPFLGTLARIPLVPSDVPYLVGDTYARTTIGTGPFRFVEWAQGDQIVLGRFEQYWDAELPVMERVVMKIVPEDGVRSANVVAGTTHIVPDPASEPAPRPQRGWSHGEHRRGLDHPGLHVPQPRSGSVHRRLVRCPKSHRRGHRASRDRQ